MKNEIYNLKKDLEYLAASFNTKEKQFKNILSKKDIIIKQLDAALISYENQLNINNNNV